MIHITFEYLIHEEKAVVAGSKVEALEAEGSKLRKKLIIMTDEGRGLQIEYLYRFQIWVYNVSPNLPSGSCTTYHHHPTKTSLSSSLVPCKER